MKQDLRGNSVFTWMQDFLDAAGALRAEGMTSAP
jgi:hypothetical protein